MADPAAARRIALLSDTHGWLDPRVLEHAAACDEVWHAGDIGGLHVTAALAAAKPLRAVWGNIDDAAARAAFPEHQRFTCGGARVWITHIGGRPPRYDPRVAAALRSDPPDLFVCGHSHILLVQFDADLPCLHLNPGAAGRHGWHTQRTMLRFTLHRGRPHDLEVIELGRRGQ